MTEVDTDAQIDALSKSVLGLDGSRRVGWAKAYGAKEKVELLSRDLNIAMADAELFRRALSRLYGFFQECMKEVSTAGGEARREMETVIKDEYKIILDGWLINRGRDHAKAILSKYALDGAWITSRDRQKAKRAQRIARADEIFESAKRKFTQQLMEKYGLRDEEELNVALSWYAKESRS